MAETVKRKAIIVGSGLAGSVLASRLLPHYAVTVVDLQSKRGPLPVHITEQGLPARIDVHAGSGPGGTTNYWHNGMIELEDGDYDDWPISKSELLPYLARSVEMLGGASRDAVAGETAIMRTRLVERGVPESLLGNTLFCPRRRRNVWNELGLREADVERVTGRARSFEISDGKARALLVETADGPRRLEGDVFICCAGGLSSPLLIAETAKRAGLLLPAVGRYYHDHPMSWVGQVTLDLKLHDVWNHFAKAIGGVLRMPFVIRKGRNKYAFYIRTQASGGHQQARSALTELRNQPTNLRNYWKVLSNGSDVLEVLAFQFGINIPSSTFSILLVAQQETDDGLSISASDDDAILRDWHLKPEFRADVEAALHDMISAFGSHVVDFRLQPGWFDELHTASHHSGGCRMGASAAAGVCDRDLKIFGVDGLYVCDGSVLPSSGYANTGMTIGALALRLSDAILAKT